MSSLLLTPEQRQIITHAGKSILIGAVAGSGKTTTLAHCVAHRERQGLAARDILVLVFTPAAEQVFRQRLSQAAASRQVQIATYATFAKSLLENWKSQGSIEGADRYLNNSQAMRPYVFEAIELAAEDIHADPDYAYDLSNLHAEIIINQLSRLKGTLTIRRFDEESDAELADSLDLPRGLISICRQYERMRHLDIGHYAFQSEHDYVVDALALCEQISEYLTLPALTLIVADEWHDANAAHIALLRRLTGPQTRVVAAGDREQVIHSWNGADPRYMGEAYAALFPGTQHLPLTHSFRCGPTLSACAQSLTALAFESGSAHDTDVLVVRYDAQTADDCPQQLIATLQGLTSKGKVSLSDCAVLLRAPHQSIALENTLIHHAIPYEMQGCASYFDRIEILMLRGILHITQGTMAPVGQAADVKAILRALGLFAGLQYTEAEWVDAERTIVAEPDTIRYFYTGRLSRTLDAQEQVDDATRRWRERFAEVCNHLIEQAEVWPAGQVLAYAAQNLKIADTTRRLFVYKQEAATVARSIEGFISYASQSKLITRDFLQSLDQAQLRSGTLKKQKNRLTLATARDAKGKEWKHVLLPYLVNGEFPDARAESGEERRLFYVAMTRASRALFLFTPKDHDHHFIRALNLQEALKSKKPVGFVSAPPRIYLNVPYAEKDEARRLGAQWDSVQRKWWIAPSTPQRAFSKWLPAAGIDNNGAVDR